MKRLLISICLVLGLAGTAIALDETAAPITAVTDGGVAVTATADVPKPEWLDKEVPKPEVVAEVVPGSNEDLAKALQESIKAIEDLRSAKGGKMVLIFLMLAAFGNLFISGIKRVVRWRAGKISKRWKKWLPRIALGLGVAVGFLAYYGVNTSGGLIAAVLYGAGPPLAVLVQEVFGPIKSDVKDVG